MKNEFTAIIERGEDGFWVAVCPEVPMAHGQGRTRKAARDDLAECVSFVLEYLRDEGFKNARADAHRDVIAVG